jgi:hypothetical protein
VISKFNVQAVQKEVIKQVCIITVDSKRGIVTVPMVFLDKEEGSSRYVFAESIKL